MQRVQLQSTATGFCKLNHVKYTLEKFTTLLKMQNAHSSLVVYDCMGVPVTQNQIGLTLRNKNIPEILNSEIIDQSDQIR